MTFTLLRRLGRPLPMIALLLAGTLSSVARAQAITGVWQTIDDRTGKPRSLVRIDEKQGALVGHILKRLDPEAADSDVCKRCTGERKDVPISGLLIIRGAKKSPDNSLRWEQGYILDPEDGKEYRVLLTLHADGRSLEVRGYIGTPLIGRTQVWRRSGGGAPG